jgi:SAM-dependent methyltransferase
MAKHLQSQDALRVLDFGPTSAGNINFLTMLGHSVYMANLVEDASKPEYQFIQTEGDDVGKVGYRVDDFLAGNLDFAGRCFDVVLLWDTLDYLPAALLAPVVGRLSEVTVPGAQLLAFFHSKKENDDTTFSRCHLTGTDQIERQRIGSHPILHAFTNRQIEGIFKQFSTYKFFLAKDSLREVIVTR